MMPTPAKLTGTDLLHDAHTHAAKNRAEVEGSGRCACFFCFRTFPPTLIKSWIDGDQTALCPLCGVDAVLGSNSSHRLDEGFLRKLNQHAFGGRAKK